MMKQMLMTAVKNSISNVMETMFFLPVELGPETKWADCRMDTAPVMACQLEFSGDVSGTFILAAPETLVLEMTENFMGESETRLLPVHLSGTLTEMLNMVCGNALSSITASVPFELGIPQVIESADIPADTVFTLVDTIDAPLAIHLTLAA